jgi:NADH-quinone oxidoreductase subunit M
MPVYTGIMTIAFFAAMGLPGLSAFISEVLVLLGAWQYNVALTIVAASAVVLTAGYMLWMLQRVWLGPVNEKYATLPDVNLREMVTLVPLAIIVMILGVYPHAVLDLINPTLLVLNETVKDAAVAAAQTVPQLSQAPGVP